MERTFDRLPAPDLRDTAHLIRHAPRVAGRTPRSYTWRVGTWLDQGSEGACVGFAWAHDIAARPAVSATTVAHAFSIYRTAQTIDEWPGEDYDGTSVRAGAKVLQQLGYHAGYRWAWTVADLTLGVGLEGPAVLGVNWWSDMFDPDENGYLNPSGSIAGGHAILCHGVNLRRRRFRVHNSWGRSWGDDGEAWIDFDAMDQLLRQDGEACFPVGRHRL